MIAPHCFGQGGGSRDHSNAGSRAAELASVDCDITCLTPNGDSRSICNPGGADCQVDQNSVVRELGPDHVFHVR